MVPMGLWTAGSMAFGIIMIYIGLLITLPSLPLAMGTVKASKYSWRPIRVYRMTDEEKDRMGKPTAKAAIVVGLLYGLAGLAIIAIGLSGNAGPWVISLFIGSTAFLVLAFAAIAIVMVNTVKRWRERGEVK